MVSKSLDLLISGSHPVPTRMQDSLLTVAGWRVNCSAWAWNKAFRCLPINWRQMGQQWLMIKHKHSQLSSLTVSSSFFFNKQRHNLVCVGGREIPWPDSYLERNWPNPVINSSSLCVKFWSIRIGMLSSWEEQVRRWKWTGPKCLAWGWDCD